MGHKKAFDSPSKNVLKFAWSRLGVPTDFAEHLVSLGENSPTIIRSNYATDIMDRQGPQVFQNITNNPDDPTIPSMFTPERGVAQGDVASPTNWNAVLTSYSVHSNANLTTD